MNEAEPHTRYHGAGYRVTHPDYRDFNRTVEVSRTHPSRFNPIDVWAVYVALSRNVAIEELKRRATHLGRSIISFIPRSIFLIEISIHKCLDLAHANVRAASNITLRDLRATSFVLCHKVALAARNEGYAAICCPSATGQGENLVIHPDILLDASNLAIVDEKPLDLDKV